MPITKKPTQQNYDPNGKPIGDPVEYWPNDSFYLHVKIKDVTELKTRLRKAIKAKFADKPFIEEFLLGERSSYRLLGKMIRMTHGKRCKTTEGYLLEIDAKFMGKIGDRVLKLVNSFSSTDLLTRQEAIALPKPDIM